MDDGDLRFAWDVHNTTHLAHHDVLPAEAEQVLAGELLDLDYRMTREGQERWTAVGQTVKGRILVVVWTMLGDGSYRPITAYSATKRLEAIYLRLLERD